MDHVAQRREMADAVGEQVGPGRAVRHVRDLDAGGVPVRLYRDTDATTPVILFAHGGGWVAGDLTTHDGLCRLLAAETGWAVLAVDYRRAPEAPFPAAFEDIDTVSGWLRVYGRQHALDPTAVVVAGDSAGGLLAAVTARRERDAGRDLLAQVLICPVLSPALDFPDLGNDGLQPDEMAGYWDAFAPPGVDRHQPDLDPFLADPAGLPPAVIVTAELDILRDEADRYAAWLASAGVPVIATRWQHTFHNFPRKLALTRDAAVAVAHIAAALRALTNAGHPGGR
ncbi:alpha/beta hydrolase [Dactylosporangium sp. NPDC005555]|uniref:alpha/beta hydrolase n=1 Tax=Dactylosporangium sp. NPDC005555 TaxID=3154889 RepID=UPI00339EAACC